MANTKNPDPPVTMLIPDLAKYLKVHQSTIYKMLKNGRDFPRFRVGSDWRFNRDSVREWTYNESFKAASAPPKGS